MNNWELSKRWQEKYKAPICEASNYDRCSPWLKQGKRITFEYSNDNERMQCDPSKCINRGMYTEYRGRCTGYDEYFRKYHNV